MIKKFQNFIIESVSDIQKDDILEIFQEYLDHVEGDKIDINITDRFIRIGIKHLPWLEGNSNQGKIAEILSQNWNLMNASIKMTESQLGVKLEEFKFSVPTSGNYRDNPSPIFFKIIFSRSGGSENFVSISSLLGLKEPNRKDIGLNLGIDDYIPYTILSFGDRTVLKFEDDDNTKKDITTNGLMDILNEDPDITNGEISKKYPFIEWKGGNYKTLVNSPLFALVDGGEREVKSIQMGEDVDNVEFGNNSKDDFVIMSV